MILSLPDLPIARVSFEVERVDFAAPEASGRQGGVQAGWPLWTARYELDRSDPEAGDLWRAFLARLRGRIRRFYGRDITRPFPLAYRGGFAGLTRAGGGSFDGSATSWSQSIDSQGEARVILNGLPAGFVISVGDYIGWRWDAAGAGAGNMMRRTLARAVLPATANGSGQVEVTVEPPLNAALVPSGAIAHLDNPVCVMQLVTEETSLGPVGKARVLGGGSIIAVQDLRP